MRKLVTVMLVLAIAAMGILNFSSTAQAEEVKFVGTITKIEIAGASATTATVTLKDTKTEALNAITVNDELTLDKLKDHRIAVGDEIRCKYELVGGKKVSKLFRKTAGC